MIINIVLILCSLVVLNFLLLLFSCNKTSKKTVQKHANLTKVANEPKITSNQLSTRHLAPTGS